MDFPHVSDSAPTEWPQQRCYLDPASAAYAELISTIASIKLDKAQALLENCFQLKDATGIDLERLGLTRRQAAKVAAAIELGRRMFTIHSGGDVLDTPGSAAQVLLYDLAFRAVEHFAVLVLDTKHRLIKKQILSSGNATETIASPAKVFEAVIRCQGTAFIVAHNHPSGSVEPSDQDLELTQQLIQASRFMDIRMLDHLIIGNGTFQSLRESTCLWS